MTEQSKTNIFCAMMYARDKYRENYYEALDANEFECAEFWRKEIMELEIAQDEFKALIKGE